MSKNVPATWPGHKTKTKIKQIQSDARLGCNVSLNRLVTLGYDTGQLGTRLDAVLLVDLHARGCGLDFSSVRVLLPRLNENFGSRVQGLQGLG